jgi:hypothetical protein
MDAASLMISSRARWGQSAADRGEGLFDDAVVGPLAALLAGDEASVDELFEVVGDGRLGQSNRIGELTDAGLPSVARGDQGQQAYPSRVSESLEHPGQSLGRLRVQIDPGQRGTALIEGCGQSSGHCGGHASSMPYPLTYVDARGTVTH